MTMLLPKFELHQPTTLADAVALAKKLGDDANTPRFIQTLHGVGYQFIGREG